MLFWKSYFDISRHCSLQIRRRLLVVLLCFVILITYNHIFVIIFSLEVQDSLLETLCEDVIQIYLPHNYV